MPYAASEEGRLARREAYRRREESKGRLVRPRSNKPFNYKEWAARSETKAYLSSYERERNYGLDYNGFLALLERQKYICPVCLKLIEMTQLLAVDHDHSCCPTRRTCGKCVRGILHKRCNMALGMFGDDPVALHRAADYLERKN